MKQKCIALLIAAIFFSFFSLAHLGRYILGIQITVGTHSIPMSVSLIVFIVSAAYAVWV